VRWWSIQLGPLWCCCPLIAGAHPAQGWDGIGDVELLSRQVDIDGIVVDQACGRKEFGQTLRVMVPGTLCLQNGGEVRGRCMLASVEPDIYGGARSRFETGRSRKHFNLLQDDVTHSPGAEPQWLWID